MDAHDDSDSTVTDKEHEDRQSVENDARTETESEVEEEGEDVEEETDEDDEDDDDEEEEEEEEPQFKYSRITSLPSTLFNSDSISSCLINDNFFAFATHGGFLHITNTDLTPIRTLRAHTASVLALSTDGHYLASASLDGTVVIGSIQDAKDITKAAFGRPVHAVSLDPNYKSTRAFISGGSDCKLILSERGWLGRRTDITIAGYEDLAIVSAHWCIGGLFIWMTEDGITIFCKGTQSIVHQIPRPEGIARVDMYKPRVCSPESNRIYIAWANTIWVLKVTVDRPKVSKMLSSASSVMSMATETKVDVELVREVDFFIGGIAPYKDHVLLLGCMQKTRESADVPPPELKIYDIDSGEETYADELALKLYEQYGVNDYHLGMHTGSKRYFVVSAKDAVIATERDLQDRIEWLVDHEQFQQAWDISGQMVNIQERKEIGAKWVDQLIKQENWSEAASALVKILENVDPDTYKEEWEHWGRIFISEKKVNELASHIPLSPDYSLDKFLYDSILVYYLENDRSQLLQYLQTWSSELYDVMAIKTQIEDHLHDQPDDDKLRRALIEMYINTGAPSSAVPHLLHLRDISVIDLVSKYHLLPSLTDEIPQIMTVGLQDKELEHAPVEIVRNRTIRSIKLVVDGRHQVLPKTVINDILKDSKLQVIAFLYLEQLNQIDPFLCKDFGDLQVKLYAEFDRPKLLAFMNKNSNYNLGKAIEICESSGYTPELVYLLGKVGQNKKALALIIEKLQDPQQAIDFAKQQNDKELWNDLIEYSMDKPPFIKMLLENADGSIDPVTLIKNMSENMEIPELRQVLSQVFTEKELVLSINQGILDIIKSEGQEYSNQLRAKRHQGTLIDIEKEPFDTAQTLVITPQGEYKTERELLGDDEDDYTAAHKQPGWSVKQKVKHLAYILKYMQP